MGCTVSTAAHDAAGQPSEAALAALATLSAGKGGAAEGTPNTSVASSDCASDSSSSRGSTSAPPSPCFSSGTCASLDTAASELNGRLLADSDSEAECEQEQQEQEQQEQARHQQQLEGQVLAAFTQQRRSGNIAALTVAQAQQALSSVPCLHYRSLPEPLAQSLLSHLAGHSTVIIFATQWRCTLPELQRCARKLSAASKRTHWVDLAARLYGGSDLVGGICTESLRSVIRAVSRVTHSCLVRFAAALDCPPLPPGELEALCNAAADRYVDLSFPAGRIPRKAFAAWLCSRPQLVCNVWEYSMAAPLAPGPFYKACS